MTDIEGQMRWEGVNRPEASCCWKGRHSYQDIFRSGYTKTNQYMKLGMPIMNYDSYNEVLDYLKVFLNKRVGSSIYLEKLMTLIESSRSEKTVTIRAIYETYMQYVKENRDNIKVISGEKEMWIDFLHHWQ
ncbi:hypothetical protein [Enterobacter cloacae]|uniref:hypothetical protein n=1 Tax=Enterobacter cloacae TaxID=550 RepID=UPI000A6A5CA4|nr:hypothetical protein [Enterobacter cloacae]MCK7338072.1 hypothetical protein [Enterobacter cloacae]MCK7414302.1 hypothetical protein [Enterobacter cloacae]MCK7436689.1 hypothetical protein [Enterobacter cloacae]